MPSKVTIGYGSQTIQAQYEDTHNPVPFTYGTTTASWATGSTKTLPTTGKVATNDIVIGDKTLPTSGKIMSGDVTVKVETAVEYLPLGGRVFYVNSSGGSGAEYHFYDASYNEITDQTVTGLANAKYYSKTGTASVDKFYVYDTTNGIQSGYYWGYYGTSCGTSDGIGKGKTNTATVLSKGVPTDYTPNIWSYIKGMRDSKVGGCDDWFIASEAEQDQLRSSGCVTWYSSYYIWSSVEGNSGNAYFWYCNYSDWNNFNKDGTFNVFGCRAF
jgi:hypothetical protein